MDDLIRDFVAETLESLDPVENDVLRLDGLVSGALHARVFRLLHTIKGTCGFLALPRLEAAAHAGEDRLATPDGAVEPVVVLKVLDDIRGMLSHLAVHGVEASETAPVPPVDQQTHVKSPGALIPAERLERLLADVAELAIVRAQLVSAVSHSDAPHLREPVQRMSHIVDLLESRIVAATMQRIEAAWRHAPRVAADIARAQDKTIAVELSGGNVEIDRAAFMALREAIVHLVRNAAGHGIETIEQRRAAGKPLHGTIRLCARQDANALVVTVADDGRGLPSGPREGVAEVTLLSGRGIGLTAVRETIAAVGGTLDIRSEPGLGVTFDIRLPLVAGVAPYMLLTCAGARFGIAQAAVLEVATLPAGSGRERFSSRHGDVRLCHLRDYLKLPGGAGDSELVIICEERGKRFGVVVDRAEDYLSLSIKPMAGSAGDIAAFQGAAVDSHGRVVLGLDTTELARLYGEDIALVARGQVHAAAGLRVLSFTVADGHRRCIPLGALAGVGLGGQRQTGVMQRLSRIEPAVAGMAEASAERQPLLLVDAGETRIGIAVEAIGDIERLPVEADQLAASPVDADGFRSVTVAGATHLVLDVAAFLTRLEAADAVPPQVVVMDDDPFCRDFLCDVVAGFGYTVGTGGTLATTGAVAIIDLDGEDAMRPLPPAVLSRAIGVTSRLDGHAARRARVIGIADVIGKFDRASLRQMLGRRLAEREAA